MLPFSLNIIATSEVLPAEKAPPLAVEVLSQRLVRSGHQSNPLPVYPVGVDRYILPAHSWHFRALQNCGARHLVVQKLGRPRGKWGLMTWYHLAKNCRLDFILRAAADLGLEFRAIEQSEFNLTNLMARGKSLLCFSIGGPSGRLLPMAREPAGQTEAINSMLEMYQEYYGSLPLYPQDNLAEWAGLFERGSMLMIPPRYRFEELLQLVSEGYLFPSDYFLVNCEQRLVGLDFPLEVLRAEASLEEKREFLKDLIRLRLETKRAHFSGGRVIHLDHGPIGENRTSNRELSGEENAEAPPA